MNCYFFPASTPPLPPSSCAFALLEAGQVAPRPLEARRRLRLASRQRLPGLLDVQALSQLRLQKSFRVVKELSTPDVGQVFNKHLAAVGFPHLRHA